MELTPNDISLVVAGAWNPAILSPAWVLRHGLEREEEAQVQVSFLTGQSGIFEPPRYSFDNINYVVRPDALVFSPKEGDATGLESIEDAVARIIDTLQHTPLNGIGHNFQFQNMTPSGVRRQQP